MREIKFRAWDKDDKKIIEWIKLRNDGGWENCCFGDFFGEYLDSNNYELMQYTGLKDKNGKEIYEGDIVKVIEINRDGEIEEPIIAEINYNDRDAQFQFSCPHNFWRNNEWVEVIGNIYQNPELTK